MKKILTYGLTAILAMGFTACDNYEEPNPAPQTNPQAPVMQIDDLTFASDMQSNTSAPLNLFDLNSAAETITVGTITTDALSDLNEFKTVVEMQGADGHWYEMPSAVKETAENVYTVTVNPDDVQGVYYQHVTKDPAVKDIQLRYALYTVTKKTASVNAVQEARIGGEDFYVGPYTCSILPYAPATTLEDAYYLVGTVCDWDVKKAIKLNHSGASVYDNPVFSYKFDIYEAAWSWIVVPASTVAAGTLDGNLQYGSEEPDNTGFGGLLFPATANVNPWTFEEFGPYLFTVNMETLEFEFSLAIEQLYTPGNSNGWSQTASQVLTTTDYANYSGMVHLNGDFKFSSQPDWNGLNYGSTGTEGTLTTDGGAGNLSAPADALYYAQVNVAALTYSITEITSVGLIGSATPLGWDGQTNLTPSADFLTWTGTVTLTDGEYKIRFNDNWDINYGGAADNFEFGGPNIQSPGAGTYNVTVDFSSVPYNVTFVK